MGVSGALLPLLITRDIAGGLMIVLGFKVKWAVYALAGFSIVAAIIFHSKLTEQMQMILFMRIVSIARGLLLLSVYGAGSLSIAYKFSK